MNDTPLPPEYMDRHAGEVALIMGEGPSLAQFDFSHPLVKRCVTFGCNSIGRTGFSPTYYVITDPDRLDKDGHLVTPGSQLITYDQNMRQPPGSIAVNYGFADIVGPPTKGRIFFAYKSGTLMLHIAYQMGCRGYFMIGLDGYNQPGPKHHYDTEGTPPRENREAIAQELMLLFSRQVYAEGGFFRNLSRISCYDPPAYCTMNEAMYLAGFWPKEALE